MQPVTGTKINVALDALHANPYQKRKKFDVTELAAGIQANGFFGNILIAEIPDKPGAYYIVAGERRTRACRSIGMIEIPAEILTLTSDQMRRLCAIENLQREDLSPLEEAATYQDMLQSCGTIDRVAEETGKNRATIEKRLALLELVPDVAAMVDDKRLNLQQAEVLLGIEDPARQLAVANIAVRGNMNVNQLKGMVQQEGGRGSKKKESENPTTGEKRVTAAAASKKVIEMSDLLDALDVGSIRPDECSTLYNQIDVLILTLTEKRAELERRAASAGGQQSAVA